MKRLQKEQHKRKAIGSILERLRQGNVIVEGKHDAFALSRLGISSFSYESVMSGRARLEGHETFILTDMDRRGREKAESLKSYLLANGLTADEKLGRRLLRMLNSACVEEIYAPAMQALETEIENGEHNGENILRYSKVHGGGEVYHKRHGGQA